MKGLGAALTALVNGSMILTSRGCGCVADLARLAWKEAATDPEATAENQAQANRAAQQKEGKRRAAARRGKGDHDEETEEQDDLSDVQAPPVDPVRRSNLEAVGVLTLAGALAAGAINAAWRLMSPSTGEWWAAATPYHHLIYWGGGLVWMAAAWMVGAPPAPSAEDDDPQEWADDPEGEYEDPDDSQDAYDDQDDENPGDSGGLAPASDRGMDLLLHLMLDLSDAEFSRRAGVHLDVLLDSAKADGHVGQNTEQSDFRAWLEAVGIPVEDKLGMRIEGRPVTRMGVRIDAVTTVLGMTPTALLNARGQARVRTPARVPVPAPHPGPPPALPQLLLGRPPGPTAGHLPAPSPTASK
ncbi:hypothetical protein [Streptomyces sp. NPDC051577]|uniref:hypothetical protein n=1 Tax=Streptomyces sp. NPDC051577 TaxID=3155166 RepID=UPI003439A0C5